ncbi:MAG TPA: right-handed parallel beta-helix repeat-containing protein [Thermoanaerobaculia bacterium]|nr:right-handed parallel beta-helix repeat-containing protein [Thermoanaerobaculia bacterium]
MNKGKMIFRVLTVLVLAVTFSSLAHAQATRTWVSGVGDDANPCSRTAPCKTFAGAISKTAAKGEINVLDPGGFGGVTITKSITISAEGVEAGVLVSGTNAIVVNVPSAADVVVLRGLDIEGLGTGLSGITVITGGTVFVENCTINRFTVSGINFVPTVANSQLHVSDTIVRNNGNFAASTGQGIFVNPGSMVKATLSHVRIENNVAGLKVQGASNTTVVDSVAANNAFAGYSGATSPAILTIERSVATHNGTAIVCNSGTSVRLGNMSIVDNVVTLAGTGTCSSFKNNDIDVVGALTPINPQ